MPPRKQPPTLVVMPHPENPNIPLHCLLCPKKPTFSDVSHLLTHVSSKSHLSNRFKAEIRAHKDRDARESLRQFEVWWDRYNIRDLLSDRMDAKDKKVPKRGRAQSPDPNPQSYNKSGKSHKSVREGVSRQSTNGSLHAHSTRQDYVDDDSPYGTPVTRRSQRLAASGISRSQVKSEPWVDDGEVEDPENQFQEEEHVEVTAVDAAVDCAPDKSKLKGVFWPGMSLFDSATDEQKRRRNQRKDATVLRIMEEVAAGVEPTECVWSEEIDLQRTRDIYATPSIFGSPEPEAEEVAEPKKKRARRSAGSIKVVRGRKKRASTKAVQAQKAIKKEEDDNDSILTSEPLRDESLETTPVDDLNSDDKIASSTSTNSPDDVYDIFRDPPAAGTGQFDAMFQQFNHLPYDPQYLYGPYDPELSSPALTWASDHTNGSGNTMNFEQTARPALQPLSSNVAMNSPSANTFKHLPHLRRGQSELSPSAGAFYSQPHHNGQGNFNNPLALTHGRPQLSYNNQFAGNGVFGQGEPKTQGFQPINMMPGMHFNPYPVPNGGNSYYAASAPQEETRDFEV